MTPANPVVVRAPAPSLCLAFANTLSWRGRETPSEELPDVHALIRWIDREAGFEAEAVAPLRHWSDGQEPAAQVLYAAAIALRETIFRVFESVAAGRRPADADFAALSTAIASAPPRAALTRTDDGYAWQIGRPDASAPQLLAPVLWSAADLLLEAPRRRIRQCANEKCLWLFVDESKSGTRRWCDMTSCGNRAKAQRHYAKVRRG
jgi:predicted RNA-binding Zn ribbon-like protein